MPYEPLDWANLPAKSSRINAARLSHMETQYQAVEDDVDNPETTLGAKLNSTIAAGAVESSGRAGTALALPVYAGARSKTWEPTLALYNGESDKLRTLREGIRRGLSGLAAFRLACVGDSKTFGSGITAGTHVGRDSYPAQLRDLLGGSTGIVIANGSDVRWSNKTNMADPSSLRNDLTSGTGGGSIRYTSLTPHTGFKLYGYLSPGGSVSVSVDGGAAGTWTITAGSPWRTYTITGLADTTHTIDISVSVSGFALRGIEQTYATTTRLLIDNHGRQSSTATMWNDRSSFINYGAATFDGNSSGVPDGVILNLGTNTPTSEADFDNLAYYITSSVGGINKPCLLVVPGGLGGLAAESTYDARRDRIYDVADSLDLPVLDLGSIVGNYAYANGHGLMGDTVHENKRGYSLEAAAIARVLRPY